MTYLPAKTFYINFLIISFLCAQHPRGTVDHSSSQNCFNWTIFLALIGPLQKTDFVSPKLFCGRFTLMFRVIVLLHHVLSSRPTIRRPARKFPHHSSAFFLLLVSASTNSSLQTSKITCRSVSGRRIICCWCIRWETLRLNLGNWLQNQN